MQHFLAIDQGTSGTKAIVVDDAGQVVSIAEVAVRPEYLAGGGVEQDPEALFDSVVTAGRQALAQAGVPVAAVALANQGETVLAWDRDTGRPLTPAVVWQDRRAESICAPLSASADTVAARPVLLGAQNGVDPGQHDGGRGGHHHRHLAGASAVRRVRHRRIDCQPVAVDDTGLGRMG
jgi:glycerol kinase